MRPRTASGVIAGACIGIFQPVGAVLVLLVDDREQQGQCRDLVYLDLSSAAHSIERLTAR
jgi:hypothetical protein